MMALLTNLVERWIFSLISSKKYGEPSQCGRVPDVSLDQGPWECELRIARVYCYRKGMSAVRVIML